MHTDLKQLDTLATEHRWSEMAVLLNGLGASAMRVASERLKTIVLPQLTGDDFWQCMATVVPTRSRALLGTFLSVAQRLIDEGRLSIESDGLVAWAKAVLTSGSTIDRDKTLHALLPQLGESRQISQLLTLLAVPEGQEKIEILMDCLTPSSAYLIFMEMRRMDGSLEQLTKICYRLMAKKERLAFNLVSLCRQYFDLPEVRGTFSLRLKPHQLSALEAGEEGFKKLLLSI